jgi:cytochrome d ubiquinol oxidase subunit I
MGGAVVTGSFAMASLGAFYVLTKKEVSYGRLFLRLGVITASLSSIWQLFPSGDFQGKQILNYQPVTLAAMEGLFKTEPNSPMVLIGQPNTAEQKLDNPIHGRAGPPTVAGLRAHAHRRWRFSPRFSR